MQKLRLPLKRAVNSIRLITQVSLLFVSFLIYLQHESLCWRPVCGSVGRD